MNNKGVIIVGFDSIGHGGDRWKWKTGGHSTGFAGLSKP
jgi:hypothetical protein